MKSLYIIITSLLPILSFSQDLFTVKEIIINEGLKSKQGKYLKLSNYVIRNSDATPDDLYHKTVLWFNENFKSDGNMILEDEKGKFIRIQGSTKELLKTHEVVTSTLGYQGYRYILDIKFKYGRYKIEPVSLKTFSKDESLSEGWYERGFSNKILDAAGEELVSGKNDMNTQLIFFNALTLNLDEFLNGNKITGEEEVW
ncbi:MAG: hypothetical protein P8I75_00970 [Flavobacteriaceae bacterium]|jgi:hypothetical protein|nr:hypothetical protein [Flavobacteriaceae bacterium]MDG1919763.1 hypothetical protein [Flavobacteriaceae bacterium]